MPRTIIPDRRSGRLAWSLAAIALLAALGLVVIGAPRIAGLATTAQRARDAAIAADALFAGLLNAETGQRGYLLTGEDSYLAPYRDAQGTLAGAMAGLTAQSTEWPADQPVAAALRQLLDTAAAKQAELDTTIRRFAEAGRETAVEEVRSGTGKRLMDEARDLVERIHVITDVLAERSAEESEQLLRWGGMSVVALLAIAFAAGLRGQRIGREREAEVAARTRSIVETAPLGIAMLDARLCFLVVNEALGQVVGRPAEEMRGRRVTEVLPPALAPAVQGLLETALARPGAPTDATIDGPGSPRERQSWHGIARADAEKGRAPRLVLLMQDITTRRAAEAERLLLIRELNHRVKNVIATVQGLANQSWSGAEGDGELFLDMFGARLRSLAAAHGLLFESAWQNAPLTEVLRVALAPWLGQAEGGLVVNGEAGPAPLLGTSQVLSLALVLHELATNAAKYGALSMPGGKVSLDWRHEADGVVRLTWHEEGGPLIAEPPSREGFGSFLISRAFDSDAVPGEVTREYTSGGLVATFRFTPEQTA
ncbi:PAS domain-containing protein [Roseomonas terrae]|uniref:histidine kinase n=1 Tax=Neoroseomonas terrae TaxID=424799 RepID=A0ABS5EHJ0_9PROT|nr:PAS domain-containing protein [Neoroseomonas terrae]